MMAAVDPYPGGRVETQTATRTYTLAEAARRLGIRRASLQQRVSAGSAVAIRDELRDSTGAVVSWRWVFTEQEVARLLAERGGTPTP